MVRNPLTKPKAPEETTPEPEVPKAPEAAALISEREINLSLINDKLNYVISVVNKIAEAAEIDLNK